MENNYLSTQEIMKMLKLSRAGVSWLAIKRGWRGQYCKSGRSIGREYLASDVKKEIDRRTLKSDKLIDKTLDTSSNQEYNKV